MTHVRQGLRSAVVTKVTGLATTGARVYTARVHPAAATEMPCLVVNTIAEEAEPQGLALNSHVSRRVTVEIVGHAKAASGLANTLDGIADEVETALAGYVTLAGVNVALDYQGADIAFAGELEQPVGTVSMRWIAQLFTLANAPGTLVQV